jgi:hypothetical protein
MLFREQDKGRRSDAYSGSEPPINSQPRFRSGDLWPVLDERGFFHEETCNLQVLLSAC